MAKLTARAKKTFIEQTLWIEESGILSIFIAKIEFGVNPGLCVCQYIMFHVTLSVERTDMWLIFCYVGIFEELFVILATGCVVIFYFLFSHAE